MTNEVAPSWISNLRREDSAELMRSLHAILDGVPILAEARVRHGIAGGAQRVAQGAGIIPIGGSGQGNGCQRWNDAMGVEHDVAVPIGRHEDAVLGAIRGHPGQLITPDPACTYEYS